MGPISFNLFLCYSFSCRSVFFYFSLCLCKSCILLKTGTETKEVSVDIGRNLTVSCPIHRTKDVMWVREGREDKNSHAGRPLHPVRMTVLENGSLLITEADRNDSGVYTCSRENVANADVKARVKVQVRCKY